MERTKEIGILRAIGASKRNISQVFNVETFIVGLCSGLIGGLIPSKKAAKKDPVAALRETLIKAFPSPDLLCEAIISLVNSCDPPEVSKETLN